MFPPIAGLLKPCYVFAPATLVRRVYLRFFGRTSGRAKVELPWRMTMEVNLADSIGSEIYKQRIFDLSVSECAWRLLATGDHVIDAGANIGYMTLLFAARVGATGLVHSFEPHPEIATALARNIDAVKKDRGGVPVILHRCALGATHGTANLFESDYFAINQGTASLANIPSPEEASRNRSHPVAMEKLDELFPTGSFALLKVDVEGFELEVLKGAAKLLNSGRITHVIYEDHASEKSGLAEHLIRCGYTIFSIGHETFGPVLREGSRAEAIDSSWESASFLATRDPVSAVALMEPRGWRVLKAAESA